MRVIDWNSVVFWMVKPTMRFHEMICVGTVLASFSVIPAAAARAATDDADPALHPQVRVETNQGSFTVELDAARVPLGVTHFMDHVERGFYRGLTFHRVLKNGLIQGGAYLPSMERRTDGQKPPEALEMQSGLSHVRGTISLIRVMGRDDVPTAEFFINISSNTGLDEGAGIVAYVPIGRVIEGQEVVDRLGSVPTDRHPNYAAGLSDVVPVQPIVIMETKVLRALGRDAAQRVVDERTRRAAEAVAAEVASDERDLNAARQHLDDAAREAGRDVVTTASGLKYVDIRVGKGAQPLFQDRVVLNFRGTLLNGAVLNDTFLDEKPPTKRVAELITGLREGLGTMGEGGRRLFLVPPDLAFGNAGIPGRLPPNTWMTYEVELLEVLPPAP